LDLQQEMGLSYLFIAHNLSVVRHISDRIAVMYLGRIIELGDADSIYSMPMHPYTQALIASIPRPDPRKREKKPTLKGDLPSPIHPPSGCHFHNRCPYAEARCSQEVPLLRDVSHRERKGQVACHFAEKIAGATSL
jgi:peptide/nickel transport system ATP-binding protein/oligopeptide transport system ATP-binding protein